MRPHVPGAAAPPTGTLALSVLGRGRDLGVCNPYPLEWPMPPVAVVRGKKCSCAAHGPVRPSLHAGCLEARCPGVPDQAADALGAVPHQGLQSRAQVWRVCALATTFLLSVVLGNVALRWIPVSFAQVGRRPPGVAGSHTGPPDCLQLMHHTRRTASLTSDGCEGILERWWSPPGKAVRCWPPSMCRTDGNCMSSAQICVCTTLTVRSPSSGGCKISGV